jgi:glycosyltransferase involved in cell wall biosynthesis
MRCSILIATLGGARLEEVVRSYLGQPANDLEVVVVVDQPSLDRARLLTPFQSDDRLRIIFNDRNIGVTRSLNKGLEACRGELILRNDDDDLPDFDRVAKTIAFFKIHPECDLAYGFARGVNGASGRSWPIEGPLTDDEIKRQLLHRNFIVHSSIAFRADRIKAIGGYDTTFRYAQDYDLYLRCIRSGLRFGCIPEVLVERHYSGDSITVRKRRVQILCSFAAHLVHDVEAGVGARPWQTIQHYLTLLVIPNWLRALRRRVGHGR